MAYTQEHKLIAIDTPLGKDELLLARFSGIEGMSRLFEFELEMLSENHAIDFKQIIGKGVTVRIKLYDDKERFFHGIISRFSQKSGEPEKGSEKPKFSCYSATMVPLLWMLTRTADSRIFQNKSIPDIIENIFKDQNFTDYELKLSGSYDAKEYCVQYHETDFNFVSRLMEQEGIFYFFNHEDKKHTLIVADSADENKPCPNQKEAKYQLETTSFDSEDKISELEMVQEIRVAKYTVNDYNFKVPNSDLKAEVSTQQPLGPGEREVYDYPAKYTKLDEGDRLANFRIQEEEAQVTTITGKSRCRDFSSGFKFDLKGYYRTDMNDKSYVLISVVHNASEPVGAAGSESVAAYSNRFTCLPLNVPFRPVRVTPKPVVEGTQPAIVVGPSGEEIYTDEFGRVKVQFIWDREGKNDENSSCWIRVSQQWAGAGWGAMFIPHIGHEVIVDFEEGDPDKPIIVGRVYNGNNQPADTLPDEKTKSVIRSWNDNDIVIEDKDGDKFIQIKQANGNEIILHETSPNIEIFQENGNKIVMTADGPKIDITQDCGNEILMHAGEGIQIRDEYGNEVVLDAAAGTMKLRSPSHESVVELGKSIWMGTMSDIRKNATGNEISAIHGMKEEHVIGPVQLKWDGINAKIHGGAVSDTFLGAKHESLAGVKVSLNASKEINKNALSRDRISSGHLFYGSDDYIRLMAPGSMVNLDGDSADITAGSTVVKLKKGGDLSLKSDANIRIDAGGDVIIEGGNITLGGDVRIFGELEHPSIKAKK
ncbi:MAG: type VI secretion system tip protein VgrG [Deltaproteobacteria bacterium]|nr:type VI secretion system tip protein VgrG [Deltaproteobacteria bacterium]